MTVNINAVRAEIESLRVEARGLMTTAGEAALSASAETRFAAIEVRTADLRTQERRAAFIDEADRRAGGEPISGTGDQNLDRLAADVGLLDVVRAQMGGSDAAAGRAREMSQELERRSGRKAEGLLWHGGTPERRTLTTAAPAGGPGSNIIPNVYRGDLFIDRLRNATKVRSLGATVLSGLQGNITIPKRTGSSSVAWFAEDTAIQVSDPSFGTIGLTPKHCGAITTWSRNMVLQSSPDVESLARDDLAAQLAEALDGAAILGTGTNAQPTGILNVPGINVISAGTNGSPLTFDNIADMIGAINVANADGSSTGFLTNMRLRSYLSKLKDSTGKPLGLDVLLQGQTAAFSNIVPSNLTKGTGTGLSALIYGNWSDLMIGLWSEIDILVNPYESTAYSKGGVSIRAAMTTDIAVRHPASFAAIVDAVA